MARARASGRFSGSGVLRSHAAIPQFYSPRDCTALAASISAAQPPASALGRRIQPLRPELAGRAGSRGRFRGMRDPRLDLTAQELIYAATALRAEARRSAEQGTDPQYGSTQEVFRRAAKGTEDLAEKFQRVADRIARPGRR